MNCLNLINLSFVQSVLTVLFLISCEMVIGSVQSISCYKCDALDKEPSDCPGWNRSAVHSVRDLGDKNGFYSQCIDIRLPDNTILRQDLMPSHPTCKQSFIKTWKNQLEKQFKTDVTITCCGENMCNGPNLGSGSNNIDLSYLSLIHI